MNFADWSGDAFLFLVAGAQGLQLLSISVPHQVGRGQDTQLKCHFVLEGHPLYSVKWFKGSHEFFRYTPNEYPRYKVFPLKELTVDVMTSLHSTT